MLEARIEDGLGGVVMSMSSVFVARYARALLFCSHVILMVAI